MHWLWHSARPAWTWIALSVALGFCSGILLIVQARLLAHIVHGAFLAHLALDALNPAFVLLAAVVALRALLAWGREISGFHAGDRIREAVRMALMVRIGDLGPAYTVRHRTGALASTVMEQVEGLHDFFAHYLPQLALAVMIPAAIVAFIFPVSWAAGALMLATAPLIPVFMVLVGMGAESISQRHFQALARLSAHFLDVLQGLATLKLFNRSRAEEKSVARVSRDYRRRTMQVLRIAFLSSAVLEFFSSVAIALVAVYLGMYYLGYFHFGAYSRPLNLAEGLFILLLAPDFYLPLKQLGTHYHARAEALGAAEEILKVLAAPGHTVFRATAGWKASGSIQVRCRDLHFSYTRGRPPVLKGISFDLNPGEQVALVGTSGAGKTTLVNLLLGFWRPDKGQILINDIPLAQLTPESWRRQIAWIGQDPVLFDGTLRDNIRLGRLAAADAEIEKAARSAKVLDFCRHLPAGLQTRVGEQGRGLSRGQAQRVALARAFLKNTPIVLLDEPTAGLDSENERLVMKALLELTRQRTVLLLTHRLNTLTTADRILVLSAGRIVESGSYGQLMASGGAFNRLATRLQGGDDAA